MALRLTVCREIRPIRVDFSMFISKANTSILCHATHYYLIPILINLTDVALELFMEFGFPSPFFSFFEKGEHLDLIDFAGETFRMRLC